ncbi:MAG: urate oxidase [Candidatus Sumerlaeaceae bacterium]|nr:urate oxidase [Candidatus Sumerlaeaceae bacterium]
MAKLTGKNFGKSRIRLMKVVRRGENHDLIELDVSTDIEGDFQEAYVVGDNRNILATDTQKNIIYALAREHDATPIENFALLAARQFLAHPSSVIRKATVSVKALPWGRVFSGEKAFPSSFEGGTAERATATATVSLEAEQIESGVSGWELIKTADSAFTGFIKDSYTTLAETDDRILATTVTATWRYASPPTDADSKRGLIRKALVETFCSHRSSSLQHTLYAMGRAALDVCEGINSIRLSMPNKHCEPVDLSAFGLDNPNVVFAPTSEPFGVIEAFLERD